MPASELIREELARAGATPDEAARLAALLERAAEPARFDVSPAEVEQKLERVRPARRTFRVPRVALGAAAAIVAVLAVVLFVPRQQEGVQARALNALGGPDSVLHLRVDVFSRVPGANPTSRARGLVRRHAPARPLDEVQRLRRSRQRHARRTGTVRTRVCAARIRASSAPLAARSPAGCAELIDPVTRYRDALARTDANFVPISFEGRKAYRLLLPLQGRIDQVVFVDAQTLLPRSIRWREHLDGGDVFVAATIELTDVELLDRDDAADAFELPAGGRTVRVEPAGAKRGERQLTIDQARSRRPFWLGPSGLSSIRELRYAKGSALVVRYGTTEIWTFGRAVPPELLASRLTETKTLVLDGRPATFYSDGVRLTVVIEGSPSVAVVAPQATKEDVIGVAERLQRLR